MKNLLTVCALGSILLFPLSSVGRAQVPAQHKEITLVFVDSLRGNSSDLNNYDRIVRIFKEVLESQGYPIAVHGERFAGNRPDRETELQVFFQGIRPESYEDITFSAWMTVSDHGAKQDLGVIRFRYDYRPTEPMEDRLDHVVRGAALLAAPKIDAFLFPKERDAKQKP